MSTHPHPAHPATPAAPAASPAPPWTPLNWAFPFTPLGKDDATDPMTYMKALAQADDGFYPLGASGLWHGGVHFGSSTATMLKQDTGVRAIADGEVVAYRLDSKYPAQTWQDGHQALYSTGFVLIRHKLQLPPVPAKPGPASPQGASAAAASSQSAAAAPPASPPSAAGTSTPPRPAPDETLTFFSLYMHLMDWNSYQAAQEQARTAQAGAAKLNLAPMPFWEGERYYRVGDRAPNIQAMPKPKTPPPAPVDTIDYDLLGEFIEAGFIAPPKPPAAQPVDDTPPPAPVKGIAIRDLPNGKLIGILPRGAELMVSETDPKHPGWQKIRALRSGQPVSAEVGKPVSPHAPWSWVYVKELDAVLDPKPLDTVVVLKQPYAVKAGDVVGQMGHYLRYVDASPLPPKPTRPLLHLEVFAGPELQAFIEKSRTRAKDLPAAKTFLEISPGAQLVTDIPQPDRTLPQSPGGLKLVPVGNATASRWVKVQPKTVTTPAPSAQSAHGGHHGHPAPRPILTDTGPQVWVEARLANTTTTGVVKVWTNFPLNVSSAKGPGADFRDVFRRTDLDRLGADNVAIDDKGHRWWNITIGTRDGSTRQGWVCEENHPLARMCGPWDWPGFELVDNTRFRPVDMLKRYIHVTDQYLVDEDKSEFEPDALRVNAEDLIVRLEKAIDANHDGKVTAQELKHAQETPWMAEALTHLVVRSESEWGGGLGKWEEMSPLMKKLLWLWKAEIERIGKLQWWEQATGIEGFPKEPTPWHFHPVGVVGNFTGGDMINDEIAWGKKVSRQFKQKVILISQDLGLNPSYLMSAMAFETGESFRPDIRNAAGSGATGLIQFMPSTAANLGTTTAQLAHMTDVEQLDYVKKYFLPKQGKLHTLEDVYCMIFYPKAIGTQNDYIIARKKKINNSGVEVDDPIYWQNAGFDTGNVGYITKYQISSKLREKYRKGMSDGYIG
ncbi:lytic transglycosylase domain-containing protein [Paraburkholderia pallida]|uniref:lytic transglycosylase domain-containing protein n=1 Tax=Paraburkholderia pallida TaxID=2547399 RepID=UPI001431C0AA|nr:lytic transglycosylase domain-containing protein [Paraburkholderia pallida]